MESGYWSRNARALRLSRRGFVSGAASVGIAAAAAGLVGCSSNNKNNNTAAKPSAQATSAGQTSASAAATGRPGTPGAAATTARSATPAALDPTKGKNGGTITIQNQAYHGGLAMITKANPTAAKVFGYAMSGLLAYDDGKPPSNGLDVGPEPDLAVALPEQPDPMTLTFKLRQGVKFHNGVDFTSQDVQYSFDSYAKGNKNGPSASASSFLWYDHTETPDPFTAVIKTKAPFADAVMACAQHAYAYIINKAFEESPDSSNKLMGTGPFLFDNDVAPVSTTFKKNPNYYLKPYPYIDQVTVLAQSDPVKPISDFISKQVSLTYAQFATTSDQIKKGRPDAVEWPYQSASHVAIMRVDQPPFNDKRVRQALCMSVDRKAIRDAVFLGQGEDDQIMSPVLGAKWGFRKPAQLGAAAKYWNLDPQGAKQLLAAAGITQPIETQMSHADANFLGQEYVDSATLVQAQWKQAGIANVKDVSQPQSQYASAGGVGNFDGMGFSPASQQSAVFGLQLKNLLWSPPEGVKAPTQNVGHVNDSQLSDLLDKQLTQLTFNDRVQTLHQIEDVLAEQQYRIPQSTYPFNWFSDPALRNIVMPKWSFGGSYHFVKYWWFA